MKYYSKLLLIIIVSLLMQNLKAQKILKEKDRKIIVKMIYEMNNEVLKIGDNKFKTDIYNSEDFFSKPFTLEEIDSCYNLMNKTAFLEIEKDRIYFVASILNSLNNDKLRSSNIEVNKHDNKLFYGKDTLKVQNAQGGGNRISEDAYQITRNYPLRSDQSDLSKIHGSMVMKIDFLAGYNTTSLTKNEIGKKLTIGTDTIEIFNIIDNSIVLKGNTDNVKLINFVAKNEVAKPLSPKDKDYDMEKAFSFSSLTMYKSVYENIAIKKISFKEFDKLMTISKLKEVQIEEQYKIIKNVAKIGENFILYKPIYKTYYLTVNYNKTGK